MLKVRALLRPVAMCVLLMLLLMLMLMIVGCGEAADLRDQRLVEFARESMAEQRQQNDRMAEQSVAVVAGSRQLTEAAQELVLQDAAARRELLAAQTALTSQLHDQRSSVDVGRDELEQDRRQIAARRTRDPLLAAAIYDVGLVLVSVLPLLVCLYVIRQMQVQEPDHGAVAEMLVLELTSRQPRFLGALAWQSETAEQPDDPRMLDADFQDDTDEGAAASESGEPPF